MCKFCFEVVGNYWRASLKVVCEFSTGVLNVSMCTLRYSRGIIFLLPHVWARENMFRQSSLITALKRKYDFYVRSYIENNLTYYKVFKVDRGGFS